jgi:hypothetical protein
LNHNRWYDNYQDLSELLDKIKSSKKEKKDSIFLKIKDLITTFDPKLIENHVLDFPMNQKRRWYDKDPFSWLIVNSLKFADMNLINKVIELLKEEFY